MICNRRLNLVITLIDLHFGGISNLILQTTPELSRRMNVAVIYFGPNSDMLSRFAEAGIKVERIPYEGGKDILKTVITLGRYIKKNNIDIVSTNFAPDKFIVGLCRITTNFKIAGTIHNSFNPEITPLRKKTWRYRFEEFFHNNIADKVIGVSYASISNARKYRNLRNKNTVVIHSGIQGLENSFSPRFKNKTVRFVTSCRLVPIKGLSRLIDQLKSLTRINKNWELIIMGDGELNSYLQSKVEDYKLSEYIHFLGYQKDIKSVLLSSDFYINSSFNEALGISIIEAMSVGLPVVASNVGGIPEVVEHKYNGFLINFNDMAATVRLLNEAIEMDQEKYNKMSKNSFDQFRQKFSIEKYVGEVDRELTKLIGSK